MATGSLGYSPFLGNGSNFTETSNTTSTAASPERPLWYWILRGIICFVTVVGNGLVIYIISTRRRLRSQPSPNWFILSLAIADFLVGAYNFPMFAVYQFYLTKNAKVWAVCEFFMNIFLIASTTNICALTLDRYIAVIHPFKHTSFSKGSTCGIILLVAWAVPALQRIWFLVLKIQGAEVSQYFEYQIFYIFVCIMLPNVFLLFAYTRIIIVAKEHRKQIQALTTLEPSGISMDSSSAGPNSRKEQRNRLRSSYNGTIAVGIVVFIFLVCNSYLLYWLMCRYLSAACKETESTETFFAMVMLRYINSAPNFIVYSLIKSDFQRELKKMAKCK